MSFGIKLTVAAVSVVGVALALTLSRPPVDLVQRGYRGTGMVTLFNPRTISAQAAVNVAPQPLGPPIEAGPLAGQVYKNVKVLGGISVGEFTRLMASITTWVAPQQGCAYCHNVANMASDQNYQKVVARRMIQMVQAINSTWKSHVDGVGVTCYTCHRGNPVPKYIWFRQPVPTQATGLVESWVGKNHPAPIANGSSLPSDPITPFLDQAKSIRVQSTQALPGTDRSSIKQTDWTYALMLHFSQSLGVNCTFCHNTRAFGDWSQSTPARVIAWYGIHMLRDVNVNYLGSLQHVFPRYRLGPLGDTAKVDCTTCHQGVYKPLFGANMVKAYPELQAPVVTPAAAVVPAPGPAAAPAPATPSPAATSPGTPPPVAPAPAPGTPKP